MNKILLKEEHGQLSLLERWGTSSHFPVTTTVTRVIDLGFRARNHLCVEGKYSWFRFIRLTRGTEKKKKRNTGIVLWNGIGRRINYIE